MEKNQMNMIINFSNLIEGNQNPYLDYKLALEDKKFFTGGVISGASFLKIEGAEKFDYLHDEELRKAILLKEDNDLHI